MEKLLAVEHSKKQCDRIVQYIGSNKDHLEKMSRCFEYVASPETPIAVKAFSLTVLSNFSTTYPEIASELRLIIEDQWEHATPSFRSRAKKVLKMMGA